MSIRTRALEIEDKIRGRLYSDEYQWFIGMPQLNGNYQLVISHTVKVSIKLNNYVLHMCGKKIPYTNQVDLIDMICVAMNMDAGYLSYLNSKKLDSIKNTAENILLKLDSLCVDIEFHPDSKKVSEFKAEFHELMKDIQQQ